VPHVARFEPVQSVLRTVRFAHVKNNVTAGDAPATPCLYHMLC
jgi:hypothetical protein